MPKRLRIGHRRLRARFFSVLSGCASREAFNRLTAFASTQIYTRDAVDGSSRDQFAQQDEEDDKLRATTGSVTVWKGEVFPDVLRRKVRLVQQVTPTECRLIQLP
jgi:hypothetical protein